MSVFQLSQDAKLREIVKIYRRVETLHPIASKMFESLELKRMFWSSLTHDLGVIRQRSQKLADGEITAVQKAFEVLMKENADGNAAIAIYMDEILGLKAIPGNDRAITLARAIQTRGYILSQSQVGRKSSFTASCQDQPVFSSSSMRYRGSLGLTRTSNSRMDYSGLSDSHDHKPSRLSDQPHGIAKQDRRLSVGDELGDPFSNPAAGGEQNEMLRKLFFTYQKAKNDFLAAPLKSLERTTSAKFLRDTTENCITYIASRENYPSGEGLINTNVELLKGQGTLDEMRSTLQEAKSAAEAGSGGKKRRFDEDWANVPERPAKMRPSSVVRSPGDRDPVPRGQTSKSKLERHSVRRRIDNQPASKSAQNIDHHPRLVTQSERTPRGLRPASAGQSNRRPFPMSIVYQEKCSSNFPARSNKHNPNLPAVYGDCYRPSYR